MCARVIKLENLPEQLLNILCPALSSHHPHAPPVTITTAATSSILRGPVPAHFHQSVPPRVTYFFDTMTQPHCWGNVAWSDLPEPRCPVMPLFPQASHRGSTQDQRLRAYPHVTFQRTVRSLAPFPHCTPGWHKRVRELVSQGLEDRYRVMSPLDKGDSLAFLGFP